MRIVEQPGAVVIHLDGGESLEIAPDALPGALPPIGEPVAAPMLDQLRAAAARKAAARDLFRQLDRKLWTVAQLRRKLVDTGHDGAAVDAVLAQAIDQGLVSDREFAGAFCRDTLRRKAVGRSWLLAKLRQKGVSGAIADEVVRDELPAEREQALAREAARSRWSRERTADIGAEARVGRFLGSRGFAPGLAREAVRTTRPDGETPDAACNSDDQARS